MMRVARENPRHDRMVPVSNDKPAEKPEGKAGGVKKKLLLIVLPVLGHATWHLYRKRGPPRL